MPIYAYRCEACGFDKDVLQKLSDAPLVDCPSCGKAEFRKQVTAAGFQLKGSGWYVTDFRDGGGKGGTASGSNSNSAPNVSSTSSAPSEGCGSGACAAAPASSDAAPSGASGSSAA